MMKHKSLYIVIGTVLVAIIGSILVFKWISGYVAPLEDKEKGNSLSNSYYGKLLLKKQKPANIRVSFGFYLPGDNDHLVIQIKGKKIKILAGYSAWLLADSVEEITGVSAGVVQIGEKSPNNRRLSVTITDINSQEKIAKGVIMNGNKTIARFFFHLK